MLLGFFVENKIYINLYIKIRDLFRLCPTQNVMRVQVTENVSLHSNSLCKNMARASGGANNTHSLTLGGGGGTNIKDPKWVMIKFASLKINVSPKFLKFCQLSDCECQLSCLCCWRSWVHKSIGCSLLWSNQQRYSPNVAALFDPSGILQFLDWQN